MRPAHSLQLAPALAAVTLLAGCETVREDPFTDASCAAALKAPDSADAIEWLRAPGEAPKQLGNFSTDESLALIHRFEALGATRLVATEIPEEKTSGASPSKARGLIVGLPDDPRKRHDLFAFHARNARAVGSTAIADNGQKFLHLSFW